MPVFDYTALTLIVLASGVLLWSSVSKLAAPRVLAASLTELGIRPGLARPLPFAIAGYEATIVVAVLSGTADGSSSATALASALVGLLGAALLLVSVYARVTGATRPCGCFGGSSSKPLGYISACFGLYFATVAWLLPESSLGATRFVYVSFAVSAVALITGFVASRRTVQLIFGERGRRRRALTEAT
jgi:hypothetical protein